MKVRALRGVCVGPNRHLLPGEVADVDDASSIFLRSIGAVEQYVEPPAEQMEIPEKKTQSHPAAAGKTKE